MRRRNVQALVFLAIVGLLFGALQTPLLRQSRGWAWDRWTGFVGRAFGWKTPPSTINDQLATLLADNIRLHAELKDYDRLREELATPSFSGFKPLPIAIVGRPVDSFHSELVLSKGAADGLVLGAPLVVNGSTLFGFVTSLNERSAIAQLLFTPTTTLAVDVVPAKDSPERDSMTSALLRGQHYTSLLLTTVPRDVPIQVGDAIVTQAKPNELPYGLFLGTVQSIRSGQNDVYQEAGVALPYDVDAVRAGMVLVPR